MTYCRKARRPKPMTEFEQVHQLALNEIFKLLPMSDADQERLVSLFCEEFNEFSATGQRDAANTINELINSITKEKTL